MQDRSMFMPNLSTFMPNVSTSHAEPLDVRVDVAFLRLPESAPCGLLSGANFPLFCKNKFLDPLLGPETSRNRTANIRKTQNREEKRKTATKELPKSLVDSCETKPRGAPSRGTATTGAPPTKRQPKSMRTNSNQDLHYLRGSQRRSKMSQPEPPSNKPRA